MWKKIRKTLSIESALWVQLHSFSWLLFLSARSNALFSENSFFLKSDLKLCLTKNGVRALVVCDASFPAIVSFVSSLSVDCFLAGERPAMSGLEGVKEAAGATVIKTTANNTLRAGEN